MNADRADDAEKRLLAAALFQMRVLLSSHLKPDDRSAAADAAWLAYALHNEALAALEGRPFDVVRALAAVDDLAPRLGSTYVKHFRQLVLDEG